MTCPFIPPCPSPHRLQHLNEYVPGVCAMNSTVTVAPFSISTQSCFEANIRRGSPVVGAPSGQRLVCKPGGWSRAVIFSCTLAPCFTWMGDGMNSYFLAVTSIAFTFWSACRALAGRVVSARTRRTRAPAKPPATQSPPARQAAKSHLAIRISISPFGKTLNSDDSFLYIFIPVSLHFPAAFPAFVARVYRFF